MISTTSIIREKNEKNSLNIKGETTVSLSPDPLSSGFLLQNSTFLLLCLSVFALNSLFSCTMIYEL